LFQYVQAWPGIVKPMSIAVLVAGHDNASDAVVGHRATLGIGVRE
jgi:hypothetical protein